MQPVSPGFSPGLLHMGGQVQGDKALMGGGGAQEGDIDFMGDLNLIDYIKD